MGEYFNIKVDYYSILNSTDNAIGIYSVEGKILFLNDKVLEYFGKSKSDCLGRSVIDVFGKDMGVFYLNRIQNAASSNKVLEFEEEIYINNQTLWFDSTYKSLYDRSGQLLAVKIESKNISKLKETEKKLKDNYSATLNLLDDLSIEIEQRREIENDLLEKESILQKSQEIGDIGSMVWNFSERNLTFSENFRSMLKIKDYQKLTNIGDLLKFVNKEDRLMVLLQIKEMYNTKSNWALEFRSAKMGKDTNYYNFNSEFTFDSGGNIMKLIGVIHDISMHKNISNQLKASYDQIRNYAVHLQTIREDERRNLARELHDEMGHTLSAFNMNLSYFERELFSKEKNINREEILLEIRKMRNAIRNSVKKLKKIITELRPEVLEALPIESAVKWLIDQFKEKSGIKIYFETNCEDDNIDKERSLAIFRIIQESFSNILKYAGAKHVELKLIKRDIEIEIIIIDDGIGFNPDEIQSKSSFGILGMKERINQFNGKFNIDSKIEKGTTIFASIPFENEFNQ